MLTFSALADPTRLRIVEMLADLGELSAGSICGRFPASPPAISQHLKVLREAGLVQVEVRAQQRLYTLNPAGITEMEQWVNHMREVWSQRFEALDRVLKDEMLKSKKPIKRQARRPKK